MIRPEEAWKRIADTLVPLPAETVARTDAAARVLAVDLSATVDVPAADVSAMDGYAVRGDLAAGEVLRVDGTIAAGDPPGARLPESKVLRIMTGAPLPAEADRILPVEQADVLDASQIKVLSGVPVDAHIRRRGEILTAGAPLLADST